jgi:hypothetical protein
MELKEMIEKLVNALDKESDYWCNFAVATSTHPNKMMYGAAVGRGATYAEIVMILKFALNNDTDKFEDFLASYNDIKGKYQKLDEGR